MQAEISYNSILGQIFRQKRTKGGFDQEQIGKRMGITGSSWSRIETGDSAVSIDQINKFAQIVGCNSWEILQEADNIAHELKKSGYKIHYETVREVKKKKVNGLGLAILGGTTLAAIVASALISSSAKSSEKDND